PQAWVGKAPRFAAGLGDSDSLVGESRRLHELPELHQGQDEPGPGEHRGDARDWQPLHQPVAAQVRDRLDAGATTLGIVTARMMDPRQCEVAIETERVICELVADGYGSLRREHRCLVLSDGPMAGAHVAAHPTATRPGLH